MNSYKRIMFVVALLLSSTITTAASSSINEIHSCLALVDFVDNKLSKTEKIYSATEKVTIHKGLSSYVSYLDDEVIMPNLLKFYGGNASQAQLMKKLFARQQTRFIKYLDDRHKNQKFATDYVVAIRACGVKTDVQGDIAASLKQTLDVMAKN